MSKNFYELIDHTADIGIVVRTETREELFQKTALAAFDIIADLEQVKPKERIEVEVQGEDDEELMVNWFKYSKIGKNTTEAIKNL